MILSEAEGTAWAVLHALGVRRGHVSAILSAGGAETLLAEPPERVIEWVSAFVRDALRPGRPLSSADELCRIASRVRRWSRPFHQAGGLVLGGDRRSGIERLDRTSSPLCFYAFGEPSLLARAPVVAVVGTRTPRERHVARTAELATQLAAAHVVVVSGGATGIDTAAHRAALEAGGSTIAVAGAPAPERPSLFRLPAIPEPTLRSLILSPHGPLTQWNRRLFASRNRFIAALADAVVIVAGDLGSGTRHTAEAAGALGVPIFAYPGDVDDPLAGLGNALITSGEAHLLRSVRDILDVIPSGVEPGAVTPPAVPVTPAVPPAVPQQDSPDSGAPAEPLSELTAALDVPRTVDELTSVLGWAAHRVLAEAATLEIVGEVCWVGSRLARRR